MPNAARAAKLALDRGAHVQFAKGALLGLGAAGVDETRAAGVCAAFSRLMECGADARRAAAADVLVAAMRAIAPRVATTKPVAQLVNDAGAVVSLTQPSPRRAAEYADAMSRTMRLCDAADALARACGRVSSLHGASRDATALTTFSRCPLFDRGDVAPAARVLLLACVRAAYVRAPVRDFAKPELVAALSVVTTSSRARDEPYASIEDTEDDKLAVLWTYVKRDAAGIPARDAPSGPPEIRVVGVPVDPRSTRDTSARVLKL